MNLTDLQGTVTLNNGIEMPYLGLGVFLTKEGNEVVNSVKWALEAGYRHIDTASYYKNEIGVGQGVKDSGVSREDIFVTSKVWDTEGGYDSTMKSFEKTMSDLDMEYLDLILIHWPTSVDHLEAYKTLEKLYDQKLVRAIGVSNFMIPHLENLMAKANVKPTVNQVEFHPKLIQQELLDFCKKNQIQYEGWAPLMQGDVFKEPLFIDLAAKYNKSIANIAVRWSLQKGVVTIPKSTKQSRIIDNANVFDFALSEEDMSKIDALDLNERRGPNPNTFR